MAPIKQPSGDQEPAYAPATIGIHADDDLNNATDVAPPLHVSTTFRYSQDPEDLQPSDERELTGDEPPVYSRLSAPNTTRLERILSTLCHGHALTYSSGLSAFHALLVLLRPRVIAISDGYHGCHGVVALLGRLYGLRRVDVWDTKAWDSAGLGRGDVVHVETPLNPTGEAVDVARLAAEAHRRGAWLSVDGTFAPPGLQDPFEQGADAVMHSGTKYVGGHSDMLCGVLVVKRRDWWTRLYTDRVFLGSVMGSFEGWLGVRSLRTMGLRVQRQSENATRLVQWLDGMLRAEAVGEEAEVVKALVGRIQHASLQKKDLEDGWLRRQMPNGFGPVFAMTMVDREAARRLPSKLRLFHHATSLGGVESLIEWRRMSDATVDDRLMRLSIGAEHVEDLQNDLLQAFRALAKEKVDKSGQLRSKL